MRAFDLVIFDLDGTLVDTRRNLAGIVNHARSRFGLPPLAMDVITGYIGDGVRKLTERSFAGTGVDVADALDVLLARYRGHAADDVTFYPGVLPVLDSLAAGGVRLALVTNKPHEAALPMLGSLDIGQRFALIVGGGRLPQQKPHPLPVRHTLETLGVPADRALLVGDGPQDLAAGRGAGVKVCAALFGFTPPSALLALGPDYAIERMADLPAIVLAG